jgi:hypothetical protein
VRSRSFRRFHAFISLAHLPVNATVTALFFETLSSSGLGHRPFTAVTRVRIPLGSFLVPQARINPSGGRDVYQSGSYGEIGVFVPQHPCNELLTFVFSRLPGECRLRDECQAHAGRAILSFRSEYSTYDKGIKTGTLSSWRAARVCLTLSFQYRLKNAFKRQIRIDVEGSKPILNVRPPLFLLSIKNVAFCIVGIEPFKR